MASSDTDEGVSSDKQVHNSGLHTSTENYNAYT